MALLDPTSSAFRKAQRQFRKNTPTERDQTAWTPFRAAEKKYKAYFPPPDLSNVLDLALLDASRTDEIEHGRWKGTTSFVSYRRINNRAIQIPDIPGLVILPSFLNPCQQRQFIKWSLRNQARSPNPSNLDTHYSLPANGLWETYLESPDSTIVPRPPDDSAAAEPSGPRKLIDNTAASSDTFKSLVDEPKLPAAPSPNVSPVPCRDLVKKLRWANIGWEYHWGTKAYNFSKGKGFIDSELMGLCQSAVAAVDWEQVYHSKDGLDWGDDAEAWKAWSDTYEPDAGIVNFYQNRDTLMAHVDRSEVCATSPLVSVSLGNAAIFLIGGLNRDVAPVPLLLRSGDVVIMSGPACRRAYHGVPRILDGTLPPHLSTPSDDWAPYAEYMNTTRININVRQVFPKGFDPHNTT